MLDATNEYLIHEFGLEGKVALVTGAAGGLGEAASEALCRAGAVVALCDLNLEKSSSIAERFQAFGNAKAFALDLSSMQSIHDCCDAVYQEYGRIDILINCAGIARTCDFERVTEKDYDLVMNVNLKGTYFMTQAVVPHLIESGKGKIVNFSSHVSQGMIHGSSIYGATKSAISALTRSMAIELAKYNIQANAVAPGYFLTELNLPSWNRPGRRAYMESRIAMGRPGNPDELAGMIVMLCSKASDYMTGQTYHVDGGWLAGGKRWPDQ